jgi:hypothetical protein
MNNKTLSIMAYKKSSKKQNYIPNNIIEQLSSLINEYILLNEDFNLSSLKINLHNAWEEKKGLLEKICYPKPIKDFENEFFSAIKSDKKEILDNVNKVLDQRMNNADSTFSKSKRDLLKLWNNIAFGENKEWDIPWIRETKIGEKFSKFEKDEGRYPFKGYTNQLILLFASHEKNVSNVVLFKKELENLLTHDFVKDEEKKMHLDKQKTIFAMSKLKGISSLTSLFVPVDTSKWIRENGSSWKSEDGRKYPTQEEVSSEKLKKIKSVMFKSQPVWSVDDVKHLFSEESLVKLEELVVLRSPENDFKLDPNDKDLDNHINKLIIKKVNEQAIKLTEDGQKAFYKVFEDSISIPKKSDFKNPIFRYAVFCHELAHSTMHLNSRDYKGGFGSIPYAKEEIIAESTSSLLVMDLKDELLELSKGKLPEEWGKFFNDYFENATQYGKSWGRKFEFSTIFKQLATEEKKAHSIMNTLMDGVLQAYKTISSGKYKNDIEIKESLREEKKMENMGVKQKKHIIPPKPDL